MWISFEGIDGSGKTTVSTRVAEELRRRGVRVVHAREGGQFSSAIAGRVRDLARKVDSLFLAPEAEFLLNLAREAQLLTEVVKPALDAGEWVITDRSIDSHVSLAHHVRGISSSVAEAGAAVARQGLKPDRTFLIDVDPDIARWRRRLRKIRDRRLGDSGRKGLLGDSLIQRTRDGFHQFARERGWTMVDNTWNSLESTVQNVLAAIDGRPLPAPPTPPYEADPANIQESYFKFVGTLSDRSLGTMLVAGLDDPRADAARRAAPGDEAAHSVTAMDAPAAWALREDLREQHPYYVARSLAGLESGERPWSFRRRLESKAPDQVLYSLEGDAGEEAYALRFRHWEAHSDEALRSLRGLSDPRAWELRERAEPSSALAESLSDVDNDQAWKLREKLQAAHPLAVLRSMRGLDHPRAWEARRQMARVAAKVVLASIEGMSGERANALREELATLAPEEVAASLARVDTPESWDCRARLARQAPVGVIKSVKGLPQEKGMDLVTETVKRHPRRLRVWREAVQFLMRAPVVDA